MTDTENFTSGQCSFNLLKTSEVYQRTPWAAEDWEIFPNHGIMAPFPLPLPSMPSNALQQAVMRMLRPLVRLLLRHGVAHASLAEWLKRLYVETAAAEFALEGRKQSVSRIALMTGINRKEVKRVLDQPPATETQQRKHNRAARIIHGWRSDSDFTDATGKPLELQFSGTEHDFNTLVKRYSGDIPARAVLDELVRTGIVEHSRNGTLRLLKPGYVPCHSDDDMLQLAGDSVRDLLETIDHNLQSAGKASRLQLSVVYDNLPEEAVQTFRKLSRERAMTLLEEMDAFLSHHDRDSTPQAHGSGNFRAGLGVYYFEDQRRAEDEH